MFILPRGLNLEPEMHLPQPFIRLIPEVVDVSYPNVLCAEYNVLPTVFFFLPLKSCRYSPIFLSGACTGFCRDWALDQ